MILRLMDLVVLVAELSQRTGRSLHDMDRELMLRGYSPEEIDQAMYWYSSRNEYGTARASLPHGSQALRVLTEFERMSINSECHGFLLRLQNLGIIDMEQFERIIARAIPVGPEKIEISDVKTIACSVIFDRDIDDVEDEAFDIFGDVAPAS